MSQFQVFQCPACGAKLSYGGGRETTVTCQYCGNTVAVPQELRPADDQATSAALQRLFDRRWEEQGVPAPKLRELKRLLLAGQQAEAVLLYRDIFGVTEAQAQSAVKQMLAGPAAVAAIDPSTLPGVGRDVLKFILARALLEGLLRSEGADGKA